MNARIPLVIVQCDLHPNYEADAGSADEFAPVTFGNTKEIVSLSVRRTLNGLTSQNGLSMLETSRRLKTSR